MNLDSQVQITLMDADRWAYVLAAYGSATAILCAYMCVLAWRVRRIEKSQNRE